MLDWLAQSPCNFFAVRTIADILDDHGFIQLDPADKWELTPGGRYYITKNSTAIFAFICGRDTTSGGFHIISSHSDSPGFKLKPNPEIVGDGGVVTLNVEKYGGPIMYTWFDRPLSMAGRVMVRTSDPLRPEERLIDFEKPICTIPHLAIHFNREVNEGNKLSVQKDMKPVIGIFPKEQLEEFKSMGGLVNCLLADSAGVAPEDILGYEMMLYPVEKPTVTGLNQEFFQSGRIDDLSMAFASLEALIEVADEDTIPEATRVMAVFDNEETGSGTKQGAASPVLRNLLARIAGGEENLYRALPASFMISADNAHAWHPNYNEKYDPTNHPVIGGGPVIKINANCKYMTDAEGGAIFRALCEEAGVNCQYFVNHSDVAGGSTLGNILTSQLDLRGVDMGCAIWAMHSATETASVSDYDDTVKVFARFFRL